MRKKHIFPFFVKTLAVVGDIKQKGILLKIHDKVEVVVLCDVKVSVEKIPETMAIKILDTVIPVMDV